VTGLLVLDHVFCMVPPDGDWAARLAQAGWLLDGGTRHAGQGTRNRRLVLAEHYLELVWVEDATEARANPLRLDRRADRQRTGASPFGIGLRGTPPEDQRAHYRLHEGLGFLLWVHRDDEAAPERPLVVVLDLPEGPPRRPATAPVNPGRLLAVRHTGPSPASLPAFSGPSYEWRAGEHRLEVVTDAGPSVTLTDVLAVVAGP
jgi:hypothetical protein